MESIGRDMLGDILAASSVDSLLCNKSVSKLWHDIICSRGFINLQMKYSRAKMKYIICHFEDFSNGTEVILISNNGELGTISDFPEFIRGEFVRVVSSFNGLLFLTHGLPKNGLAIIVCNLATRKYRSLPIGSPSAVEPTIAIAFNIERDQYKVFRFFKDLLESKEEWYACELYEPKTGLWRRIENARYRPFITPVSSCNDHVCVDGIVYWFGYQSEDPRSAESPACIMSVNMYDEKFKTINFPKGIEVTRSSFLINLKGRLSLITVNQRDCGTVCKCCPDQHDFDSIGHLWVLKDSNQSTWRYITSVYFHAERICCIKSVVAHKSEIFFIIVDVENRFHYHILNLEPAKRGWTTLELPPKDGNPEKWAWPVAFPFSESLYPCGGMNP